MEKTIERFIQYIRAEKRYSEHTVSAYRADLERFEAFLITKGKLRGEGADPAGVTSDDIRMWIMSLSEGGLGASSVNRMTSSVRAFFRWLRKTGVVDRDIFARVGFQRKPSRLPVYIPENQMEELIELLEREELPDDITSQRNTLIILLFYTAGLRLEELRSVRTGDFSNGFRELKVTGKGNKERVVPVVQGVAGKIKSHIAKIMEVHSWKSPGFFLFLNKKGEQVSRTEIYNVVRTELAKAGVQGKKSPHVLRHTFATHMLNDGADIKEIQELLGHNSLSATQVYTHNNIARLKEVYKGAHPRATAKEDKE